MQKTFQTFSYNRQTEHYIILSTLWSLTIGVEWCAVKNWKCHNVRNSHSLHHCVSLSRRGANYANNRVAHTFRIQCAVQKAHLHLYLTFSLCWPKSMLIPRSLSFSLFRSHIAFRTYIYSLHVSDERPRYIFSPFLRWSPAFTHFVCVSVIFPKKESNIKVAREWNKYSKKHATNGWIER